MGTLDNAIHALNVESKIEYVKNNYPEAFILAIDAAFSDYDEIGSVVFRDKPIKPGAGVGKDLTEIGDCSVVGIVNKAISAHLDCTRLSFIRNVAKNIANEIILLENIINTKK